MKKSETKEIPLNRIILPISFIFFSILTEIVSFLLIGFKTNSGAVQVFPTEWLFDIGAILIIAGLIYIVKNPHAMRTLFFVFLFLQLVLCAVNINIYTVFGDMFTLDYVKLGDEGLATVSPSFIDFKAIGINVSILVASIIFVVLLYVFNKKTIVLGSLSPIAFSLITLFVLEAAGVGFYSGQLVKIANADVETIEDNDKYLYESFLFKTEAYRKFGYYGFYAKNFIDTIFGKSSGDDTDEELLAYIEEGKTQKSDLDARFENDNLIVILCESHEWFAYDPINTPFIWDLMTKETNTFGERPIESQYDATVFTNFHAHNKTNISEGVVFSGNIPKNYPLEHYVSQNNFEYVYTLPKLFKEAHKDQKVVTNYFHSWKGFFYDRDTTYISQDGQGIGFDNFYSLENYLALEGKENESCKFFGDFICDSDFVKEFGDQFVPDKETADVFMSCFATITTHGAYTYENPRYADLYEKYDQNFEKYSAWLESYTDEVQIPQQKEDMEQFRRYKVGAMEFDRTIETIFNLLKEKGRLDDTTVVMYADHNAYYDDLSYKVKGVDKDDFSTIKAHKIPLIIYNSKLAPENHTDFCNTYDIFPTICELHGLTYNKNLVQGYNLFSDEIENSFFASHLGGMFDEKFYSNNISDVISLKETFSYDDLQKFKNKAEKYYQTQKKLEEIYMRNLAKTF